MPQVTLTINGEENYGSNYPIITIGRTSDNNVSLPDDSNISRYHARIEQREDGYWFVDQGSSNGSSVNGNAVDGEILLESGDEILLGGSSRILFETDEVEEEDEDEETSGSSDSSASVGETTKSEGEKAKGSSGMMLLAGTVIGVALISVAVAGVVFWKYSPSSSKCEATAQITSPRTGEVLTTATDVKVEITNSQCVQTVVYLLNGKEIASSSEEPFTVSLDPQKYPELANGGTNNLSVELLDAKEERISQPSQGVYLAFETLETPTPTPEQTPTPKPGPGPSPGPKSGPISPIETKQLGEKLIVSLLGGIHWNFDLQFWVEVNKKIPEYMSEGYYTRANKYSELINTYHAKELNMDAPVSYILAMSRSKFNPVKQGAEEGLWRMSNDFVTANSFNAMCGTENIGDTSQDCATRASAAYLKEIYLDRFGKDVIYTVAAFGMSPQEAAEWEASLPDDRRDFWKILNQKQREEVVRFFAAAIVTEYPNRCGLKKDYPLSNLYRITMSQ